MEKEEGARILFWPENKIYLTQTVNLKLVWILTLIVIGPILVQFNHVCLSKKIFTLKTTFESQIYKSKVVRLRERMPNKFLDLNCNCDWPVLAQFNPN